MAILKDPGATAGAGVAKVTAARARVVSVYFIVEDVIKVLIVMLDEKSSLGL